jgi:hypothetical protein
MAQDLWDDRGSAGRRSTPLLTSIEEPTAREKPAPSGTVHASKRPAIPTENQ